MRDRLRESNTPGHQVAIVRFEAYDHIQPGTSGEAYISTLLADGTTWVASTDTVPVYDKFDLRDVAALGDITYGQNHYLPGECGYALYRIDTKRYEIIGEHGLVRVGKADAAITDGSSGTVSIWNSYEDTTYNVTAHNTWLGYDVVIGKCTIKWLPEYGKWVVIASMGYKSLIRFTLTAALTTANASSTATIRSQYGPGIASPSTGAGAITVHNFETASAGTYAWEGDSGAAGLATWDSGTNYRIIFMECP